VTNQVKNNGFASSGKIHFTKGLWSIPHALGVHFNAVTLVLGVGPEVVLILKESAQFAGIERTLTCRSRSSRSPAMMHAPKVDQRSVQAAL